jgi:hypothetical protein
MKRVAIEHSHEVIRRLNQIKCEVQLRIIMESIEKPDKGKGQKSNRCGEECPNNGI